MISNIGDSHIENLGSREGILQAKLEILDGMDGGTLIVNDDDPLLAGVKSSLSSEIEILICKTDCTSDVTLNNLSPSKLLPSAAINDTQAVAAQEAALLTRVPGIGKKTAERLLLELKGKLGDAPGALAAATGDGAQGDIAQALLALGYSEREAAAALKALPAGVGVTEGIKLALRALTR
jgi:hypothetical protein